MQKEVIECYTEVAMETKRWRDFVEYIIIKKSYELSCAFRDLWSLVMFGKYTPTDRAILRTFKTSLVPMNHEMHSR